MKSALTAALNDLLAPIRAEFDASPDWQAVEKEAYPPPVVAPKVKKEKKTGDPALVAAARAAAAARKAAAAQPDGSVKGPDAQEVTVGRSTEETLEKLSVAEKEIQ